VGVALPYRRCRCEEGDRTCLYALAEHGERGSSDALFGKNESEMRGHAEKPAKIIGPPLHAVRERHRLIAGRRFQNEGVARELRMTEDAAKPFLSNIARVRCVHVRNLSAHQNIVEEIPAVLARLLTDAAVNAKIGRVRVDCLGALVCPRQQVRAARPISQKTGFRLHHRWIEGRKPVGRHA